MTATTKEQRELFARLYEGVTTAIPRPRDYREADRHRLFHMVLTELPALIADSERLAAIEAVAGEEVRELADLLRKYASHRTFAAPEKTWEEAVTEAATALLSLSAKVADQEEEIERLNGVLRFFEINPSVPNGLPAIEAERDTLRRLLTETAVPALELAECDLAAMGPTRVKAREAISTIRAQMEG